MKIFIAHSWSDVGLNIQTKEVAKRLSDQNEVLFFTQARVGKPELKVDHHLTIVEWPDKRPNRLKDILFACRKIRQQRPSVFVVHFGATNASMLASWLCRVKYRVCWMHTLSEQYYLDSKKSLQANLGFTLRKMAYQLATHIIVQNEFGRRDAIERYRVPARKIHKIYNGIFNNAADVPVVSKRSVRFIGRLDHSKGVDLMIRAVSALDFLPADVVFEIAGKGTEEGALRVLVDELGLQGRVLFNGYFSHYKDAIAFVAGAYCLVVPSRMDNFPTVVLEALAAGVPVVAFAAGGIPDMIEDGKDGLLVPAEDVEALGVAISRILSDEALRARMSAHASASFTAKFSIEQHVYAVEDFINNLSNH